MSRATGKMRVSSPLSAAPPVPPDVHKRPRRPTSAVDPVASANGTSREQRGWWAAVVERIRRRLAGESGPYGVSLLIHFVFLAVFAIPVIRHASRDEPIIAAIVEESAGGGSAFGLPEMINTELTPPSAQVDVSASQFALPELTGEETIAVSKALFGNPDGDGGQGSGSGSGIGAGEIGNGMLQFVPKNAVRAGSFAAWTTPVYDNNFPRPFGAPDPQPGDAPRPGQNYWITIQVKLPGDRRRYSIRDLTGEVVGTDGYRQRIPEHTYLLTREGKLAPLRGRTSVPVIEGIAQFVVRVPGARQLVKDTIVIKSKLLDEEQTLELVFQAEDGRDVTEDL